MQNHGRCKSHANGKDAGIEGKIFTLYGRGQLPLFHDDPADRMQADERILS